MSKEKNGKMGTDKLCLTLGLDLFMNRAWFSGLPIVM